MKMGIPVPEVMELINEIRQESENLFEVIRTNVKGSVGQYLSELMVIFLYPSRYIFTRMYNFEKHKGVENGKKKKQKVQQQFQIKSSETLP